MTFALGSITDLNVQSWEGFDYPEIATVTALLGNGAATGNAVIQSSALTIRRSRIAGTIQSSSDLSALRAAYEGKTVITFTDDDAATYSVYVFDLQVNRIFPSVWNYSATLVEAP